MTVQEIIDAARQYTQIGGSEWFTQDDEYRSINRAYRDIYEKIISSDDEYFITEVEVPFSSLTEVRAKVHSYQLPYDWHRLRRIVMLLNGDDEMILEVVNPQAVDTIEGYRYFGNTLRIMTPRAYNGLRIEYYPTPASFSDPSDIIQYPPQLEPLIIAYQMAMDIAKQQNADSSKHAEEYLRLWQRFEYATKRRDNFRYKKVTNVYKTTLAGW